MEIARGIVIPIKADNVESPEVIYGNPTAIYFQTDDEKHGRITFENLDSIKVSRGELIPYKEERKEGQEYCWVLKVENSSWLTERYQYEKRVYGSVYEFGGNVDEMLTDFHHFVFRFHDEFVEVIARGFWFEKSDESLLGKNLMKGHPFLSLLENSPLKIQAHDLTCQVRINPSPLEELKHNTDFCSQKLIEFALELDGNTSVNNTLVLSKRQGRLVSVLRGSFGKQKKEMDGVATLDDVRPIVESYMKEVRERRKAMGK